MNDDHDIRVAVFGLGEAGSVLAADLAAAGLEVHAYDPAERVTPAGVTRHDLPADAVIGVDAVLAITAAADAETALRQALDDMPPAVLYADLATSSAAAKRRLETIASGAGLDFADVALLAAVPGRGIEVEQLASGPGAGRYSQLLGGLGTRVTAVSGQAGDAATRKLLRSIVTKGLASLLIEAMRAGEAAGLGEWLWAHLVDDLTSVDQATLVRLVEGTATHAHRRCHEMEAARELLVELGTEPVMTRGTVESLARVGCLGIPQLPTDAPSRGTAG